jgi:lysophospholipase L1-like esterase
MRRLPGLFLAMSCSTALLAAQEPSVPGGIVSSPCPPPVAMPDSVREQLTTFIIEPRPDPGAQPLIVNPGDNPEFGEYLAAINANAIQDWPRLCRFRAANDDLINRGVQPGVVFMGDSITENWLLGDPGLFDDNFVNRGISAQTTPHMLLRFRNDVIDLKPRVVHILAGTNDVAGNTGPTRPQDFKNNIMSMVELAHANGIAVILGSIPPANRFYWSPDMRPAARIRELNTWLQQYAVDNGVAYIDYYNALAGPDGELRPALGNDGVHPNRAGYVIMGQLLEAQLTAMTK